MKILWLYCLAAQRMHLLQATALTLSPDTIKCQSNFEASIDHERFLSEGLPDLSTSISGRNLKFRLFPIQPFDAIRDTSNL